MTLSANAILPCFARFSPCKAEVATMRLVSWLKSIDLVSEGGQIGLKVIESGRANFCYTGIV